MAAKDEFRARAVRVARDLFIEKGFAETFMTDVADALGVSKPTVYDAFPAKQALLEAVVEASVAELDLSLTMACARGEITFADYLRRMPDECWSMVTDRDRSAMYRLLIQEGPSHPAVARAFTGRVMQEHYPAYHQMIQGAIDRGECRPIGVDHVRRLVMSPINTVMLQAAIMRHVPLDETTVRTFFRHYFEMLSAYLVQPPQAA